MASNQGAKGVRVLASIPSLGGPGRKVAQRSAWALATTYKRIHEADSAIG